MKLLEKILVPVNLDNNNPQLEVAVDLAKRFNSQVMMIYVLPEEAKRESINHYVTRDINNSFEEILSGLDITNVNINKKIEYGNAADKIMLTAEVENVNLILFSNIIESPGSKFKVGVVAEKIIRKSQKPVWIIKEGSRVFPERILCSVDYSDASKRALNNAIKLARTFRKQLYIINVYEPVENNFSPRYSIDFDNENKEAMQENEKLFNEFLDEFNFTGIEYHATILNGAPEKEIIDFITRNEIDLLLMGATGKTFIQRILLGSVTEKVIRELPSSMVITKSENILNLKIDSDISEIEKHLSNAHKLEETGYFQEAIEQLKICLQKNDIHIPTLNSISRLYEKTGKSDLAEMYRQKIDIILERLWDKDIELKIRRKLKN